MAIPIPRPEPAIITISAIASPPCVECAHCKPAGARSLDSGELSGYCLSPENTQDSRGTVAEHIADIDEATGHCNSFVYRNTTTRGQAVA